MRFCTELRDAIEDLVGEIQERNPGMSGAEAQRLLARTLDSQAVLEPIVEQADWLLAEGQGEEAA